MPALVNCTPHPLRLALPSGRTFVLPAAPRPARLVAPELERAWLDLAWAGSDDDRVEVLLEPAGACAVALPAPRPATCFVVSRVVAERCRHRADLLVPATGPGDGATRDAHGRVVAVTRLKRLLPAPLLPPAPEHP